MISDKIHHTGGVQVMLVPSLATLVVVILSLLPFTTPQVSYIQGVSIVLTQGNVLQCSTLYNVGKHVPIPMYVQNFIVLIGTLREDFFYHRFRVHIATFANVVDPGSNLRFLGNKLTKFWFYNSFTCLGVTQYLLRTQYMTSLTSDQWR